MLQLKRTRGRSWTKCYLPWEQLQYQVQHRHFSFTFLCCYIVLIPQGILQNFVYPFKHLVLVGYTTNSLTIQIKTWSVQIYNSLFQAYTRNGKNEQAQIGQPCGNPNTYLFLLFFIYQLELIPNLFFIIFDHSWCSQLLFKQTTPQSLILTQIKQLYIKDVSNTLQ